MNTTQAIERRTNAAEKLANIRAVDFNGNNKLARLNMRELKELAEIFVASGSFQDIKSVAQAQVKILTGAELGFSPIQSMIGVHFFNGKPSIGANLIASLIKDSGKYEYKITEHTDQTCSVLFYQRINDELKSLGTAVTYTYADATKAGLTGKDNWKKYPKDMLFAACIRQGARRYCADILRGVTAEADTANDIDVDARVMDETALLESGDTVNTVTGEVLAESQDNADAEAVDSEYDAKRFETVESITELLDVKIGGKADIDAYMAGRRFETMTFDELIKMQGDLAAL